MGHDLRHPIRKRLTLALAAVDDCVSRGGANSSVPPIPEAMDDEQLLREWVLRHHAQLGLDPVWILTGIGQTPERGQRPTPPSTPVFAMSTIDPRTGTWLPQVVDRIALGPELIAQGQFVIRMEDRSMEPRIRQGAYLIVDPKQTELPHAAACPQPEGRIFAVELPGEGLVARMTHVETTSHRVVLSALREDSPPFFLPRGAASVLVKGRVVRLAQTL